MTLGLTTTSEARLRARARADAASESEVPSHCGGTNDDVIFHLVLQFVTELDILV